jgi:predicted deacylase
MSRGIKAITVEIGNPQLIQSLYVQWSYMGVMRILAYLNMFTPSLEYITTENSVITAPASGPSTTAAPANLFYPAFGSPSTIICSRGFWIYTKTGGVLEVYPSVNSIVKAGDLIARIKSIFGNIVDEVFSPESGVVSY